MSKIDKIKKVTIVTIIKQFFSLMLTLLINTSAVYFFAIFSNDFLNLLFLILLITIIVESQNYYFEIKYNKMSYLTLYPLFDSICSIFVVLYPTFWCTFVSGIISFFLNYHYFSVNIKNNCDNLLNGNFDDSDDYNFLENRIVIINIIFRAYILKMTKLNFFKVCIFMFFPTFVTIVNTKFLIKN